MIRNQEGVNEEVRRREVESSETHLEIIPLILIVSGVSIFVLNLFSSSNNPFLGYYVDVSYTSGFEVTFGLWFGFWGCLGSYLGAVLGGFTQQLPLTISFIYFLPDFLFSIIPLTLFRFLELDESLKDKRSLIIYLVFPVLFVNLVDASLKSVCSIILVKASKDFLLPLFLRKFVGGAIITFLTSFLLLHFATYKVKNTRLYIKGVL